MGKVIIFPVLQEIVHRPDDNTDDYDLTGATVIDVDETFNLAGLTADWGTGTLVADVEYYRGIRLSQAQAFLSERRAQPLPVSGIVAETIVADCSVEARLDSMMLYLSAQAAVANGLSLDADFDDHTGANFVLNASETVALGSAIIDYQNACLLRMRAIRALINAATTPEDILAVDIEDGYP